MTSDNEDYTNDIDDVSDSFSAENDGLEEECNGDVIATPDAPYDDEEATFAFSKVGDDEKTNIAEQNKYIKDLLDATKLQILQRDKFNRLYSSNGELGLLYLFLTKSFF